MDTHFVPLEGQQNVENVDNMADFDAFDASAVDHQTRSAKTFVTLMVIHDRHNEYENVLEADNVSLARKGNKIQ